MNNRELDLLQKAVDGTLSKRERERLNELIETNADFRTAYKSHMAAAEALKRVKSLEPPTELHHNIVNAINHHRYPRAKSTPSFASSTGRAIENIKRGLGIRYVTGFATGVVAAILLLGIAYDWPPIDSSNAGGTIGAANQTAHRAMRFTNGKGDVKLWHNGNDVIAEIRLTTASPVQIQASFYPETADIVGIAQDAVNPLRVRVDGSKALITHRDSNRYVITLRTESTDAGDLSIRISDPGGVQVFYLPSLNDDSGNAPN